MILPWVHIGCRRPAHLWKVTKCNLKASLPLRSGCRSCGHIFWRRSFGACALPAEMASNWHQRFVLVLTQHVLMAASKAISSLSRSALVKFLPRTMMRE